MRRSRRSSIPGSAGAAPAAPRPRAASDWKGGRRRPAPAARQRWRSGRPGSIPTRSAALHALGVVARSDERAPVGVLGRLVTSRVSRVPASGAPSRRRPWSRRSSPVPAKVGLRELGRWRAARGRCKIYASCRRAAPCAAWQAIAADDHRAFLQIDAERSVLRVPVDAEPGAGHVDRHRPASKRHLPRPARCAMATSAAPFSTSTRAPFDSSDSTRTRPPRSRTIELPSENRTRRRRDRVRFDEVARVSGDGRGSRVRIDLERDRQVHADDGTAAATAASADRDRTKRGGRRQTHDRRPNARAAASRVMT